MNDNDKLKKAIRLQSELIRFLNVADEKARAVNRLLKSIELKSTQSQSFKAWVDENLISKSDNENEVFKIGRPYIRGSR